MKYEDWINALEVIAEKHGLLLSTELINFAEDAIVLARSQDKPEGG